VTEWREDKRDEVRKLAKGAEDFADEVGQGGRMGVVANRADRVEEMCETRRVDEASRTDGAGREQIL
jgi:hypothetical protein